MLATEQGGVKVYETALRCVQNDELKEEWEKYLAETTQPVEIVTGLIERFAGDPDAESPGRLVVRHIGLSLVKAMEMALKAGGPPEAAQLVAAECVVEAETKDHLNWELLGEAARGPRRRDGRCCNGEADARRALPGLLEEHGCPDGSPEVDWQRAEHELGGAAAPGAPPRARHTMQPTIVPEGTDRLSIAHAECALVR